MPQPYEFAPGHADGIRHADLDLTRGSACNETGPANLPSVLVVPGNPEEQRRAGTSPGCLRVPGLFFLLSEVRVGVWGLC